MLFESALWFLLAKHGNSDGKLWTRTLLRILIRNTVWTFANTNQSSLNSHQCERGVLIIGEIPMVFSRFQSVFLFFRQCWWTSTVLHQYLNRMSTPLINKKHGTNEISPRLANYRRSFATLSLFCRPLGECYVNSCQYNPLTFDTQNFLHRERG